MHTAKKPNSVSIEISSIKPQKIPNIDEVNSVSLMETPIAKANIR